MTYTEDFCWDMTVPTELSELGEVEAGSNIRLLSGTCDEIDDCRADLREGPDFVLVFVGRTISRISAPSFGEPDPDRESWKLSKVGSGYSYIGEPKAGVAKGAA